MLLSIPFQGGVIGIEIRWNCDLDWKLDKCDPEYTFRRSGVRMNSHVHQRLVPPQDNLQCLSALHNDYASIILICSLDGQSLAPAELHNAVTNLSTYR